MTFAKKPLKWTAVGQEPSELKKSEGFKMDESPAPGHFDFMFRSTYEAIAELQQKAGKVKTVNNEQPDSNGNVTITLPDISKFYQKPTGGIPKTDLAKDVQTSLEKADSALQKVTKADVGLGNVDNTSDANKPVSTAQQAEFNKKANLASPTFTGTPKSTTATAGTNTTQIATTAFVKTAVDNSAITINDSVTTHQADLAYQTAGGTANAITLTTATLTNGYAKTFIASASNNGSATTINGKPLYKPNTTTAPTLIAGKAYTVWYNQTSDCFFIKASAEGTATTAQVLAGATFSNDIDNGLFGTMNNNGSPTIIPSGSDQSLNVGYYSGGVVKAVIFQPGDFVWLSNDGQAANNFRDNKPRLVRASKITGISGVVRVKFDLSTWAGGIGYAQIYVNDLPRGILRSATNSTTFTEDITFVDGDIISIYTNSFQQVDVLNFRLCTSFKIGTAIIVK